MKVKVTWQHFNADKFIRDVEAMATEAFRQTAQATPRDQTERIPLRIRPSNRSQRENTPAVAAAKRKRLGHDIPLRDTGVLGDPSLWRVRRKGRGYEVLPPPGRRQVIGWLRKKRYGVLAVSPELRKGLKDLMRAGIRGLRRQLRLYMERRGR